MWKRLRADSPHCRKISAAILSDLNMTGVSGFELLSVPGHPFPMLQVDGDEWLIFRRWRTIRSSRRFLRKGNPSRIPVPVRRCRDANREAVLIGPPERASADPDYQGRARPCRRAAFHGHLHGVPEEVRAGTQQRLRRDPTSGLRLLLQSDSLCNCSSGEAIVATDFLAEARLRDADSSWCAEPQFLRRRGRDDAGDESPTSDRRRMQT